MTALEWLAIIAAGSFAFGYLFFRFGFVSRFSKLKQKKKCMSCRCSPKV
jgi:hypothetical protein